jgi:hypothetical protein
VNFQNPQKIYKPTRANKPFMRMSKLLKRALGLDTKGDLVGIAIGVIAMIIAVAIGYLVILYTKSTLPTSLLSAADNASLQSFVSTLTSVYLFFTVVVLVAMAGIVILVLRGMGGGSVRSG